MLSRTNCATVRKPQASTILKRCISQYKYREADNSSNNKDLDNSIILSKKKKKKKKNNNNKNNNNHKHNDNELLLNHEHPKAFSLGPSALLSDFRIPMHSPGPLIMFSSLFPDIWAVWWL